MVVTLEQLKNVDLNKLPFHVKKMLKGTIKHVEKEGGKAWVHPHVLADFGIN